MYNTNLIGRGKKLPKKLIRIKRDGENMNNFVVREISMSGCSSSKNPSFS